ncbi:DNA methyltransferase [Clostridium baratii]
MKDNIQLYKSNCLEKFKEIEDESISALITDPPYNISRKNNFKSMGRSGIDFGEWDKGFDLTGWITLVSSKIKNGGNIVIFNDWKNMSYITEALELNGFDVKDLIRWEKSNPMPRNRDRRFITDYEVAVWAVKKGEKWTLIE